jgi:hypothetical protein
MQLDPILYLQAQEKEIGMLRHMLAEYEKKNQMLATKNSKLEIKVLNSL